MKRAAAVVLLSVTTAAVAAPEASADPPAKAEKAEKAPKTRGPKATAAQGAGTPNAEDRVAWQHDEFPERGYPNGWLVASQGNSPKNWSAGSVSGVSTLELFTDDSTGGVACANLSACPASQCVGGICRQRVKQKSPRLDFTFGRYQWRVYVPSPSPADAQFSVGAFLYADDAHELDFECGAGKKTVRQSATLLHLDGTVGPANLGDMVCLLVSQANPAASTNVAMPMNVWHTLEIEMTADASNHYEATWSVDGVALQMRQLSYGPADPCEMYVAGRKCTWQAFISTENLGFIGDTYPKVRNAAHFDWFRHAP
jgi:hypothetical protein